jgi:hypothetical protein
VPYQKSINPLSLGKLILDTNRIKKKQCIETGKIAENSKRRVKKIVATMDFLLGLNRGDGLRCDYQMVEPPPPPPRGWRKWCAFPHPPHYPSAKMVSYRPKGVKYL